MVITWNVRRASNKPTYIPATACVRYVRCVQTGESDQILCGSTLLALFTSFSLVLWQSLIQNQSSTLSIIRYYNGQFHSLEQFTSGRTEFNITPYSQFDRL
jgi:hypothetical protein